MVEEVAEKAPEETPALSVSEIAQAANGALQEPTAPPVVEPVRKKVAIFGTTPTRMEGPWQDGSGWERWTIGPGGKDAHNWERLFEIHMIWPENFSGYLNDLSNVKAPRSVYSLVPMKEAMDEWRWRNKKTEEQFRNEITGDWSTNVVIDREKMFKKYGRTWFSSSISYLCALAIDEGASDIGLWGIDLESGEEYIAQYAGCRYFIDIAKFFGINIHVPVGCGLLREPNVYPDRYQTNFALHLERKAKLMQEAAQQHEARYDGIRSDACRLEGRLMAFRDLGADIKLIQSCEQELINKNIEMGHLAATVNHLKGESSSVEYFRRMYVYNMRDPEEAG